MNVTADRGGGIRQRYPAAISMRDNTYPADGLDQVAFEMEKVVTLLLYPRGLRSRLLLADDRQSSPSIAQSGWTCPRVTTIRRQQRRA